MYLHNSQTWAGGGGGGLTLPPDTLFDLSFDELDLWLKERIDNNYRVMGKRVCGVCNF